MIYVIPDATVILSVPHPPTEFLARLFKEVEPEKVWRMGFPEHLMFEGAVGEDTFTLTRFNAIGGKGVAKCYGRIEANEQGGSDLHLEFAVPKIQYWKLLILTAAYSLGRRRSLMDAELWPMALFSVVLMVAGVACIGLLQFNIEVRAIQKHLKKP